MYIVIRVYDDSRGIAEVVENFVIKIPNFVNRITRLEKIKEAIIKRLESL